jgi:hypothetical protein
MPDDASAQDTPPSSPGSSGFELPLTTIESFIAALVEAGPEVAEHMVRAAQELLLAAQALVSAAERNLAEQRRLREEAGEAAAAGNQRAGDQRADDRPADDRSTGDPPTLRRVDEVA